MKKIITLLFAVGAFASVNAQTTREEARKVILGEGKTKTDNPTSTRGRDVILGGGSEDNRTYPTSSSRQAQIDQVNRDYDAKIFSIRRNSSLSEAEKERIIRDLENERARKIARINKDYDGDGNYKKEKKDNGKHLGWEKGKGNPHKNGGTPGKGKGKKG